MAIVFVKEEDFDQAIKEGIWIADFYTDHCGPCKLLDLVIDQLVKDNPIINVAKCHTEKSPKYVDRFDIKGTPTMLFFVDGEQKGGMMGLHSKEEIEQQLSDCIY